MSNTTKEAVSHLLVAGTTLCCIFYADKSGFKWVHVSYGVLCIYSLVGLWRYGNPRYGDDSENVYQVAAVSQRCLVMPCIVSELYLCYGYEWNAMAIHALIPIVPVIMYAIRGEIRQEFIDLMMTIDFMAMGFISIMQENYWGIVSGITYFLNNFVVRLDEFEHVPNLVIYNIGLCFFVFFSSRAITEANVIM